MANFRLRIIQGTAKGSELPLTATKMSLGRDSQNDLMIADSQLSRVHAHLVIQNDSILIKDNDSRNGVYVNNERVKEKLLRPGDQIGIGRTVLQLLDGAHEPASSAPLAKRKRNDNVSKQTSKSSLLLFIAIGLILLVGVIFILKRINTQPTISDLPPLGMNSTSGLQRTAPPPSTPILPPSKLTDRQRKARELVQYGDSLRQSGNIVDAHTQYRKSVTADPTCAICKKRLDLSEKNILDKIDSYERAALIAFEAGRFQETVDRLEAAINLLGDLNPGRKRALKSLRADALKKLPKVR